MKSVFQDRADRAEVERLLVRYVSVNSVNPAIDGGSGESDLARLLYTDLLEWGFDTVREPVHAGGRDNILATLPGRDGAPIVMFHAHLDTVGLSGKATDQAVSSGGNVYGRGACDTKGSLVAMVEALRLLREVDVDKRATVVLVGGIDEEVGGSGAQQLAAAHPEIEMAVVGEPTGLEIATAHKGVLRFEIATQGNPAHSSKPHLGRNAIYAMGKVLDALQEKYLPSLDPIGHPLTGPATLTVTTIRGGTGHNVVPAECVIGLDRRVIPGENTPDLLKEFDRVLDEVDAPLVRKDPILVTTPLNTPSDAPVVEALTEARHTITGRDSRPIGVTYGTDASAFDPAGITCVVFGPGSIDHAHSDEEWVEIEETARAAEILAETALRLA
ncbi:MAG: M20 family metallopeptidase [Acidimicrobiia bacterium]|nr:M20/M25/M40 family metallo-hydrolase [bacterium]MDE0644205.1 M20/M25/M40 family metallo-hydrolase [bacterium]MXZ07064.1 M20 family metallopeptidase [Acidimicrobiia bacterium]MYF26240.1 M20 family metallopeptidase [Acidimicrobiia bacterium]MYH55873.1 M20 family metallopeptidase [Acidimicrobiia bacterium]